MYMHVHVYLSGYCFLAVEALGTRDTPPMTFDLCRAVIADADLVVPLATGHTLDTLHAHV